MASTTNVDIDAEYFGAFLGDDETFQFFTDLLSAPLSELDQSEPVVADISDPTSEGQGFTAEIRPSENQLPHTEQTEPVSIGGIDDAADVISSASYILPRPISSNQKWRKEAELLIFGETIDTPRSSAVHSEDAIDGPLSVARSRITEILPGDRSEILGPDRSGAETSEGSRRELSKRRTRRVLGPVKGNNKRGQKGELRCTECRKVHLKCVFFDEKDPCARCSSRRLECKKVYGKKREFAKVVQIIVASSNEIPRSPSAPNYIEMSPGEQQAIQYVYRLQNVYLFLARILRGLKFTTGIYINNVSLRYALLAFAETSQGNYQQHEEYRRGFWSGMTNISRSNITIDHMIAFAVMISGTTIDSPDETREYLREAEKIAADIADGHISLDFLSCGVERDLFIHAFRYIEKSLPIKELDSQSLAPSRIESLEEPLPTFSQLCNLYSSKRLEYGREFVALEVYTHEQRYDIRSCYKRYLRSKLTGEQIINTVTPLLRHFQEHLRFLETYPLVLDMIEMDPFMSKKARPSGILDGPLYQGIFYSNTGIDPPCIGYSDTHDINLRGELIERNIPANAPINEQKSWFKRKFGLKRELFYLSHLQNLILLNLMETAVHGYSTRDGGDFAIKLTIMAAELHALARPLYTDHFAFIFSLAELQLRRLNLEPDDLNWFLAMKQTIPVQQKERLANWELINDDFEVFRELLIRYEYWAPLLLNSFISL